MFIMLILSKELSALMWPHDAHMINIDEQADARISLIWKLMRRLMAMGCNPAREPSCSSC
jgi:hypothetical protein